jgi:hypothetical protein
MGETLSTDVDDLSHWQTGYIQQEGENRVEVGKASLQEY